MPCFHPLILFLIPFTYAITSAQPVRFDQIPDDVTGYAAFNPDRFVSSRAIQETAGYDPTAAVNIITVLGQHAQLLLYSLKSTDKSTDKTAGDSAVLLWRTTDPRVHVRIPTIIRQTQNVIRFTYAGQEISYGNFGIQQLIQPDSPATQPSPPRPPTRHPTTPPTENGQISIGLSDMRDAIVNRGPSYAAVIDPDLIILSDTLPGMAHAVDVIQGKAQNLAQHDPQDLKVDPPPGWMITGAGLQASLLRSTPEPADHDASEKSSSTEATQSNGGFNLDLFGSLRASIQLAKLTLGENDTNLYVHATVAMKNADASQQLQNLILGTKALLSLTQENTAPVLIPLTVQTQQQNVEVDWSWPLTRLPELKQMLSAAQGDKRTTAATKPTAP